MLRVDGEMIPAKGSELDGAALQRLIREVVPERLLDQLEKRGGADFSTHIKGVGRFRVNAFIDNNSMGLVMRRLVPAPPTLEGLGLPDGVRTLEELERGLVLVTGPTGSGKSSTCAALIEAINSSRKVAIVTLEDPIEILHPHKMGIVHQREVGTHVEDFASGLRQALRQDPDVILVGEMRDQETVEAALSAAQTGHLVVSTLHTTTATEAVNRVLSMFDPAHQAQVRASLAEVLEAVVAQRLVPAVQGGRAVITELMLGSQRVRDCIRDPELTVDLELALRASPEMHTFEDALVDAVIHGNVDAATALRYATRPHDLRIALKKIKASA